MNTDPKMDGGGIRGTEDYARFHVCGKRLLCPVLAYSGVDHNSAERDRNRHMVQKVQRVTWAHCHNLSGHGATKKYSCVYSIA